MISHAGESKKEIEVSDLLPNMGPPRVVDDPAQLVRLSVNCWVSWSRAD